MNEVNDIHETAETTAESRFFRVVFTLLLAANVAWILGLRILPFVDLPFRMAAANILHNIGRPGNHFADFYVIPTLLTSNVFYMIFASCRIFPNVEFATKVFYVIYVTALPLGMLVFIRRLGGNPWFALLSFLLIFNFSARWGFTDYTLGIATVLWLVIALHSYCEKPHPARWLVIAGLLTLLFFMHFQMAMFAAMIFLVTAFIAFRRSPRRLVVLLLAAAPLWSLMVYRALQAEQAPAGGFLEFQKDYYFGGNYVCTLLKRCHDFVDLDFGFLLRRRFKDYASCLFAGVIVVPLLYRAVTAPWRAKNREDASTVRRYPALVAFFVCSLCCFAFLPSDLNRGQRIVYERFSVFALLSIIAVSSIYVKPREFPGGMKLLRIVFIVAPLLYLGFVSSYFLKFERNVKYLTPDLFPEGGTDQVLAPLEKKIYLRDEPIYLHLHMYFNVWKNGVASGLVDYLYGVVQRKADRSKLPPAGEWAAVPFGHHGDKEFIDSGFLAKREYQHVEYLLVEEDEPALIEGFKQVKQGPPWYLFQRVHDDSAPR